MHGIERVSFDRYAGPPPPLILAGDGFGNTLPVECLVCVLQGTVVMHFALLFARAGRHWMLQTMWCTHEYLNMLMKWNTRLHLV